MPCSYNELKALGIKDSQLENMKPLLTQSATNQLPSTLLGSLNMNAGNFLQFLNL